MSTEAWRATVVVSSSAATPRLALPARARRAVVDAGWWPRSWDPVAELPGLVAALSDRYGSIRHVMLNSGTWKGEFRRLAIGSAVVRIGWFASLDPALLIATTVGGDQLDILVVAPETAAEVAELAMTAAADPNDTKRAPERLADLIEPAAGQVADRDERAIWDIDGGRVSTSRAQRPQTRVNTKTVFG